MGRLALSEEWMRAWDGELIWAAGGLEGAGPGIDMSKIVFKIK